MPSRTFSLAEANALLPQLKVLLEDLVRRRREALRAGAQLKGALQKAGHNGGGESAGTAYGSLEAFARRFKATQELLEAHGVLLKDVDRGLVDFPAVRNGRPVYLCWQLGEGRVAWWHDREAGFAGRQPLSDEDIDDED